MYNPAAQKNINGKRVHDLTVESQNYYYEKYKNSTRPIEIPLKR